MPERYRRHTSQRATQLTMAYTVDVVTGRRTQVSVFAPEKEQRTNVAFLPNTHILYDTTEFALDQLLVASKRKRKKEKYKRTVFRAEHQCKMHVAVYDNISRYPGENMILPNQALFVVLSTPKTT